MPFPCLVPDFASGKEITRRDGFGFPPRGSAFHNGKERDAASYGKLSYISHNSQKSKY
jgi:hypothetical protein